MLTSTRHTGRQRPTHKTIPKVKTKEKKSTAARAIDEKARWPGLTCPRLSAPKWMGASSPKSKKNASERHGKSFQKIYIADARVYGTGSVSQSE